MESCVSQLNQYTLESVFLSGISTWPLLRKKIGIYMFELIKHLWPQFELIRTPGLEMQEIAVWIWIVMMVIMAISIVAVLYHSGNFYRRRKKILKLIDGQDRSSLAQSRVTMLNAALEQDPDVTGALWREFDESLVYSADKTRLSNTLDAEHFFNNYTLAYGLTSSRLLAAAPTFLTAIGVLGTFLGLTLGLKGLQINAGDVETLKDGISVMINGAAVAFMTSVWGVLLSLVLNLFEKLVERRVLRKIRELQQKIDFLYPRLPAEHSLVQIAAATDESKEALQELHERIGDRLQETVSGMSSSMQEAFTEAINTVMAPAIKSLVNNTSQQSSHVLEQLVSNFMDGMKTAGLEQGQLMKSAAEEVRQAVAGMTERMEAMFRQLDEQQSRSREYTEGSSREFAQLDRKSTRLNSSHVRISYAVFCLKKKKNKKNSSRYEYKHNTHSNLYKSLKQSTESIVLETSRPATSLVITISIVQLSQIEL